MAGMPAKIFQGWQGIAQNHPFILAYVTLLGGKVALFCAFVLCVWVARKVTKTTAPPVFDVNWHMGSVAEIFFIFVGFQAIAVAFKNPFLGSSQQEGVQAAWAIVEYLFLFVLLWVILRFVLRKDLAHVGWHAGDIKTDAQIAMKGVLFLGVLAVLTNFLYWTEILAPSTKIIHHVKFSNLFSQGLFSLIPLGLVLLVSPVCEETFYRGFIYPVLRNTLPQGISTLLLSLFFAAVHFQWNYFILLFFMSWAATVAYEKTQRLLAPAAIHISYNVLVLLDFFTY